MLKRLVAILALGLFCTSSCSHKFANSSVEISESWKPKEIMNRDFWMTQMIAFRDGEQMTPTEWSCLHRPNTHFPLKNASPGIQKIADEPAFHDVAVLYECRPSEEVKRNTDGTFSVFLPNIPATSKEAMIRPFFIHGSAVRPGGINPYKKESPYYHKTEEKAKDPYRRFFFGKYNNNPGEFAEWKKKYPNFVAFYGRGEWMGDASQWLFEGQLRTATEYEGFITPEEAKKIKNEYFVPEEGKPFTKEMHIARGLKLLDRSAEILFGDMKNIYVFDGYECVGHLAAYHGCAMAGCETSRQWQLWQNQMICERGAARQFDIPWLWYIASFNCGRDINGKFVSQPYEALREVADKTSGKGIPWKSYRPLAGLSHNLVNRAFYQAYLSGVNFIAREGYFSSFFHSWATWELSPEGKNYVEFYNFTRENPDRGTPYAPVALLRPMLDWSSRSGTTGDNGKMDNAFLAEIYRLYPDEYIKSKVPGFQYEDLSNFSCPHDGVKKAGFEMGFANTAPYGDAFDALTPNFPDQTSFKRIISSYKAAILIGQYKKNPDMVKTLSDYVKNGGTLVINTRQLNTDYPQALTGIECTGKTITSDDYMLDEIKLVNAKVIHRDKAGNPLFTRNQYGKGTTIVTTPRYMIPNQSTDWLTFKTDALSGKLKFPHVKALLEMICAKVNPVKVDGDIQFGLNKTKTGWWLYLFNNKGVMKLDGKEEWFDLDRVATVSIDFDQFKITSVKELRSGETLMVKDNKASLKVNPGDFKILELK